MLETSVAQMGLSWLLSPIDPSVFEGEYWGKLPLRVRRHDAAYYVSLLPEAEIEFALFAASKDADALEILSEDDKRQVCRSHAQAITAFRQGKSLRINSIQRYSYLLSLLCRNLEQIINCPISVNMYLTPGSGQKALQRHHDTHDVFVLQVHGNKSWRLYDSPLPAPLEFLPLQRLETVRDMKQFRLGAHQAGGESCALIEEFILQAGDCLYLPRGYWHEAQSEPGKTSCHLTVGIQPTTYLDVLTMALSKTALSDLRLREPLPFGFATAASASNQVSGRIEKIVADLPQSLDPTAALGEVTAHFLRAYKAGFENNFLHPLNGDALDRLDADSRVRLRKGVVCAVRPGPPAAHLFFGSQQFEITPPYEDACRFIAKALSFKVGELPGDLALPEKLTLVRQLMSEGLLIPCEAGLPVQCESPPQPVHWLPRRVDLQSNAVRWIEIGSRPLTEPFFHQTVNRLKRENRAQKSTPLCALEKLNEGMRPAGFIFHISRCGSTVLSNGLRAIPHTVVISEPPPVGDVLSSLPWPDSLATRDSQYATDQERLLVGVVKAYGQRRTGEEKALILKLSSWNILHIATIRKLWPQVPCVVVVRDPVEVAVSCIEDPPGWMRRGQSQREAIGAILGPDAEPPGTITDVSFCARALAEFLRRAAAQMDTGCRVIDYKDLTTARIVDIARFFGVSVANGATEVIQTSRLVYSKDPSGKRLFVDDVPKKQAKATEAFRSVVDHYARSVYEEVTFQGRDVAVA